MMKTWEYIVWKSGDSKGYTGVTTASTKKQAERNAVVRWAGANRQNISLAQFLRKQGHLHVKLKEL